MSVFPLLYLLSGVVLNTVSQHITDLRFSAPEAHIIPAVKFSATLVGAALRRPARSIATREQAWLMAAIGLLDASAYTVYCLGFFRLVRLPVAALFSTLLWRRCSASALASCTAWCAGSSSAGRFRGVLRLGRQRCACSCLSLVAVCRWVPCHRRAVCSAATGPPHHPTHSRCSAALLQGVPSPDSSPALNPLLPPSLQGATLSNLVLSGVGQVLTAGFTRFLLRKRLTNGQIGGILFVGLGLAIRAAPAAYFQPSGGSSGGGGGSPAAGAGLAALSPDQVQGAAMVALAALLYSLLVRGEGRAGVVLPQ